VCAYNDGDGEMDDEEYDEADDEEEDEDDEEELEEECYYGGDLDVVASECEYCKGIPEAAGDNRNDGCLLHHFVNAKKELVPREKYVATCGCGECCCAKCEVEVGGYHHVKCGVERCPLCNGYLDECACELAYPQPEGVD
jgi:hypothetical protein